MADDLDSLDDLLLPSSTTTQAKAKFRPKTRPKAVKPAPRIPDSSNKLPELEASNLEVLVSDGGKEEHSQASMDKPGDVADMVLGMESPDNSAQFASDSARVVGGLQPSSAPGALEAIIPSNHITSSSALEAVSYGLSQGLPSVAEEPMAHEGATQVQAWDLKSNRIEGTDPNLVTKETCISDVNVAEESMDYLEGSSSEALIFRDENAESSEHGHEKSVEVADMYFSMECLEDILQPVSVSDVLDSVVGSDHSPCSAASVDVSAERHLNEKELPSYEEPLIHGEASNCVARFSESVANSNKEEAEAMRPAVESHDDDPFDSTAASVKPVGKFRPKLLSRSRVGKGKSVPLVLPDAVEPSPPLNEEREGSGFKSTASNPTFTRIIGEGDDALLPSSTISNVQIDHVRHGEENAGFSGLGSLENFLAELASTAARPDGKFCPKPATRGTKADINAPLINQAATEATTGPWDSCPTGTAMSGDCSPGIQAGSVLDSSTIWASHTMVPDFSQEQEVVGDTSTLEAAFRLDEENLQNLDEAFGKDIFIDAKRKTSDVNDDEVVASLNVEETTQAFPEERPSSEIAEDGIDKVKRNLRKRINVHAPASELDDRSTEDWDVEYSNISLIDEENSDEYVGEEMPKQKRAPRRLKRQVTENKKSGQRSEKASAEPDSNKEPPVKKKFPHGTRRGKRQVDKVLLDTPEEDLDIQQLSIKNLIWLAEARERISNKEEAILGKAASDHRVVNYHSFMNKPKSARWSKSETELFYQAIRQFGTDFAMIQQLFPNRTRHQVKLKFKNEERKHPLQVSDAVVHRSKDDFHFKLVMEKLRVKAEEQTNRDATDDPVVDSEDVNGDDEIQEDSSKPEKEQWEANVMEHEIQSPMVINDWEGEDQSSLKFSEFDDAFEWDANASSHHDLDGWD